MEKATVTALLEKYFEAGTTLAEEKALAEYFRLAGELDPELAPYRDLFQYFVEESEVSAGPDLEERILQRVGLSVQQAGLSIRQVDLSVQQARFSARPARRFHLGFIMAAASIVAIAAGLFWLTPGGRQATSGGRQTIPGDRQTIVASTSIHDTYDDPEQALAAVRHALLVASTHLNEGRRSITGDKK